MHEMRLTKAHAAVDVQRIVSFAGSFGYCGRSRMSKLITRSDNKTLIGVLWVEGWRLQGPLLGYRRKRPCRRGRFGWKRTSIGSWRIIILLISHYLQFGSPRYFAAVFSSPANEITVQVAFSQRLIHE